jgi:hypothetical protein
MQLLVTGGGDMTTTANRFRTRTGAIRGTHHPRRPHKASSYAASRTKQTFKTGQPS